MKNRLDVLLRTRYAETDQMGYIHHGVYAQYLEVARIEFMKNFGISYKKMEFEGVILPVYKLDVKFLVPLTFDEEITIRTFIKSLKGVRLTFGYEVYNEEKILTALAEVVLVFANAKNGKPIKPPKKYLEKLENILK